MHSSHDHSHHLSDHPSHHLRDLLNSIFDSFPRDVTHKVPIGYFELLFCSANSNLHATSCHDFRLSPRGQ